MNIYIYVCLLYAQSGCIASKHTHTWLITPEMLWIMATEASIFNIAQIASDSHSDPWTLRFEIHTARLVKNSWWLSAAR